jgi:hypothetical protein
MKDSSHKIVRDSDPISFETFRIRSDLRPEVQRKINIVKVEASRLIVKIFLSQMTISIYEKKVGTDHLIHKNKSI